MKMDRRNFIKAAATVMAAHRCEALVPNAKMKITRVTIYAPENLTPLFNQSNMVVTVETDAGITGVGEGGMRDTLMPSAGRLIGEDPLKSEHLWQDMNRAFFYPAGRERTHAIGALDLALWDIKGKALGVPVHRLLGGAARNFCECYSTGGVLPGVTEKSPMKERARATMEAGYRAFRFGAVDLPANQTFDTHERLNHLRAECEAAREGVGADGNWLIDFHQRFDLADAVRGCNLIADLHPVFVEDPVRTEAFAQDLPTLRTKVNVPLAAGEEWGNRWDFNRLVEEHSIDYVRATLPNVGGITEMVKIAALCETHFVGIVPHFTGPIATAALVHCLSPFSGPLLMEYPFQGHDLPHLKESLDFRNGKLYPNDRPGLGVELDLKHLTKVAEVNERVTARAQNYYRTDGSITNW